MPKKTKREKVLAELHRKLASIPQRAEFVKRQNREIHSSSSLSSTPSFVFERQSIITPKTKIAVADYSPLKHDLIRITIFTFLALMFQIVVYFFLRLR